MRGLAWQCAACLRLQSVHARARGEEEHAAVLSWEAVYQACDTLWIGSGVGERFGYRQMARFDSPLTEEGRTLCAELAAATPGMVRYVQNHWVASLDGATHMPGGTRAFDGHAEHWFESRESYEAAMASEQWQRTVADGPTGFDASTLVGGALV